MDKSHLPLGPGCDNNTDLPLAIAAVVTPLVPQPQGHNYPGSQPRASPPAALLSRRAVGAYSSRGGSRAANERVEDT